MATPARTGTSSGKTSGSQASLTISHAATTDPLIVLVDLWQQNVSTITLGGVALTRGGRLTTGNHRQEWWYLAAPSSGTANVVITPIASTWMTAGVYSVSGIPATDGALSSLTWATSSGSGTTATITISSRTGDLVIDQVIEDKASQTYAVAGGQTKTYGQDSVVAEDEKSAGSEKAGASSVTMTWTLGVAIRSEGWAMQALNLPDASAGGTTRLSQVVALEVNEGSSANRISTLSVLEVNEGSGGNRISSLVALVVSSSATHITPPTIGPGSSVYTPTLGQRLALPSIGPGSSLYGPVSESEQAVTTPTITGGGTLYAPATIYPQYVELPTIAAGSSVYAPTRVVHLLYLTLASRIGAGSALYKPTVIPDSITLVLPTIASGLTVYGPLTVAHVVEAGTTAPNPLGTNRPLLLFGLDLLSHEYAAGTPLGYVSLGEEDTRYTGANLINGSMGSYAQATGDPTAFAVDAGRAILPEFGFAFNTSFDDATEVRLQSSDTPGFLTQDLNIVVTGSGKHRWVDLRGLNLSAMRYWRWHVEGPGDPFTCGEIVLAVEASETPAIQWGSTRSKMFIGTTLGTTPLDTRWRRAYNAHVRRQENLVAAGSVDYVERLLEAIDSTRSYRWPLVYVPNDSETDCWLVELMGISKAYEGSNRMRVTLALVEQGGGVFNV